MSELTREQIEEMRSTLCDERGIDDLCDMALRSLEAEKRVGLEWSDDSDE